MSAAAALAAPKARTERAFKIGVAIYLDPAPELEPLQSLRLYVNVFPHLATATLAEPYEQDGRLIYEVEKPPVQSKGGMRPAEALDVLKAWRRGDPRLLPNEPCETAPETAPCTLQATQRQQIHRILTQLPDPRASAPWIDPLCLPPL